MTGHQIQPSACLFARKIIDNKVGYDIQIKPEKYFKMSFNIT